MMFEDGRGYHAMVSTVFDKLIYQKQMPVTIAVIVNPGVVPAANNKRAGMLQKVLRIRCFG